MNVFKKAFARVRRMTAKQAVIAGVFALAVVGAAALGNSIKQTSYAFDCSPNAIMHCGAGDPNTFINKIPAQGDLSAIYNGFGLQSGDYARFRGEAKQGIAYRNGDIVVDGQVVATNSWSIGRSKKAHSWNWNGYWADYATVVNRSDIPVMVLFDENGDMEFAAMYDCGNPTTGNIQRNSAECHALTKSEVPGEKDTYLFTVNAPHSSRVSINKVEYNFGDGTTATANDLNPVKHKFTKPGNFTVTVKVTFNMPFGKVKTVEGVNCKTQVTVLAPYYACVSLMPRALNDKKTQFRFTVTTSQGNGATLKDVDFTLDGKTTTTGVTAKDTDGKIFKDYSFDDSLTHTIVAKVNFNVADGVQSKTCQAQVTPEKAPECKPGIPVGDARCQDYCKPGIPVGDSRCQDYCKPGIPVGDAQCTPPELPNTGMGNLLGLFAGTSAAGALAHRVVTTKRRRG